MFTFNRDIYKKIMCPSGTIYLVNTNKSRTIKECFPNSVRDSWEFLYPEEIKVIMPIGEKKDCLSTMNSGKFDPGKYLNYIFDNLRIGLKGNAPLYNKIYQHLFNIIDDSALMQIIIREEKKQLDSIYVDKKKLDILYEKYEDGISSKKDDLINQVRINLIKQKDVIFSDKRFDSDFSYFIKDLIEKDPIRVVGILCVFALFPEEHLENSSFVEEIKEQYMNSYDISLEIEANKEGKIKYALTPFVDVSAENVLFRDIEIKDIINELNNNNGVILYGFSGCGKTTLARRVYSIIQTEFDYSAWINYKEGINLKQNMLDNLMFEDEETQDEEKKWNRILKLLRDSTKSKLFVIDNIEYIFGVDKELVELPGWRNIKVLLTSNYSKVGSAYKIIEIDNLGNDENCEKCLDLFYHYNPRAAKAKELNYDIVKKICKLAAYNTYFIEVLAKASKQYKSILIDFYNELINKGFLLDFKKEIDTLHDYNYFNSNDGYKKYKENSRTICMQLERILDLDSRNIIEKQLLFFLFLKNGWVHDSLISDYINDIERLVELGWVVYNVSNIYFESYYLHPLVEKIIEMHQIELRQIWDLGEVKKIYEEFERKQGEVIIRLLARANSNLFDEVEEEYWSYQESLYSGIDNSNYLHINYDILVKTLIKKYLSKESLFAICNDLGKKNIIDTSVSALARRIYEHTSSLIIIYKLLCEELSNFERVYECSCYTSNKEKVFLYSNGFSARDRIMVYNYIFNNEDHMVPNIKDFKGIIIKNNSFNNVLIDKWRFSYKYHDVSRSIAIYSVLMTAIANDLDVYAYLKYIFELATKEETAFLNNLLYNTQKVTIDWKGVLPWSETLPKEVRKKKSYLG